MTADLSSYDKILRDVYKDAIFEALNHRSLLQASPEWVAWMEEWREPIPLTPEQERENAEWKARLPEAKAALEAVVADREAAFEAIREKYHIEIFEHVEDGPEIDDLYSTPPHVVLYRTKDGAPPPPPMWPNDGRTVTFRRNYKPVVDRSDFKLGDENAPKG